LVTWLIGEEINSFLVEEQTIDEKFP